MCVLAMDVDQMVANFPKLRCVDGRSIDVGAATPLRVDDTSQDQLMVRLQIVCREPLGDRHRAIENGGDFGACRTLAKHRRIGALAEGQGQGVNQD